MNKAQLVHIVYSGPGGTSDYVFNLIRGDKDGDYRHAIVFFGVEKCPDSLFQTARKVTPQLEVIQKAPGFDSDAYASLKGYLRSVRPCAVTLHVNSLIQPLASRMPDGAKLIFVEHQANHLKTRKELLWSVLAQHKADAVISLTESYQAELKGKLRFLYRPHKNYIIRTGIDTTYYACHRSFESVTKLGMVSRINSFRDHATLLEAFIRLNHPTVQLHIAGDGPLLTELRTRYDHPRIFFHGLLSASEVAQFLKDLDIYIHATLGETSSLSLMQAQAAGLPIIAPRVNGIINILDENTARLVESKNVGDYVAAMQAYISSPELRMRMGHASAVFAEKNLSCRKMTAEFLNLLK